MMNPSRRVIFKNKPSRNVLISLFIALAMLSDAPRLFAVAHSSTTSKDQSRAADLLREESRWTARFNGEIVRVNSDGLRIEIAPGKDWAIAGAPDVRIPAGCRRIRIRLRERSRDARWFVRLFGDLRGVGVRQTASLSANGASSDETITLHPNLIAPKLRNPIELQLGLEGKPGDFVVFDRIEFLVDPTRRAATEISEQRSLPAVDAMPNLPRPLKIIDWREKARAYDRFVFDANAKGEYLPLFWIDNSRINMNAPTFGLSSYVGDDRRGGSGQEGINCMGAVLGATLAGIDKRRQEHDYVRMCEAFYNAKNGQHLVLNGQDQGTGGSFWYEIWPHVLFYALADRYPDTPGMEDIIRTTSRRWADACDRMRGSDGRIDFDHTAFNFATMKPVNNGHWIEPDAAAGIGWLEYAAWRRFRDPKLLQTADSCMTMLSERKSNPYYEVLLPWGALTAARMNAELGRRYDMDKLLDMSFGISDCRGGWGVIVDRWHGYDCSGLIGSFDNRGGYAFAMNTFAQAGALVPLPRYAPRYARAIGKWMLNLANAARYFYPNEWPASHQSSAFWKGDPQGVIAYEGLRHEWNGIEPYAAGDPVAMKWGPKTDLGLYGSSYVGILGGIVRRTEAPGILQLDCLATDFYRDRAYPTYLYYNPYSSAKRVTIEVGPAPRRLYEALSNRFVTKTVRGRVAFRIPADRAVMIVVAPATGKVTRDGSKRKIGGVVVSYLNR